MSWQSHEREIQISNDMNKKEKQIKLRDTRYKVLKFHKAFPFNFGKQIN